MNKIINNIEFKQCPINPIYYVSKDGQIYSEHKKDYLTWNIDLYGYPRVDMVIDNKQKHIKVHRIVWITWVGNIKPGEQINHKDDDKLNPSLDNLYIGTQKENIKDCFDNNHRVGHVYSLKVFDKNTGKIETFCPASKFIEYSGHNCKSGSISKMMNKNWFKVRYNIIYFKQIESVTTMADECKPVE